jgi:hypothetical protein
VPSHGSRICEPLSGLLDWPDPDCDSDRAAISPYGLVAAFAPLAVPIFRSCWGREPVPLRIDPILSCCHTYLLAAQWTTTPLRAAKKGV